MTREEAIEEIKRWTPILLNSGQCTEKTSEAQDMAISALSENKGNLISRQAVKDIILGGVSTDTDADKEYVCGLIDNLPSVENMERWIPTIERLPEIGDTVLCSVKTHESDHRIIICKYCAEEFWKDGRIRAWQPLPEPYYKAESEDK